MKTSINEDIAIAITNYILTIGCLFMYFHNYKIGYLIGGIICFLLGVFETYVGASITNEYNRRKK